jgi:hypothetical protein
MINAAVAEISPAVLGAVVAAVLADPKVKTATKVIDTKLVVRASRYGKPDRKDATQEDLRVTVGRPNYATRQFIAAAVKAGEPLPVRKIQIRFYPVPRTKK